jgi:hypothetical protein
MVESTIDGTAAVASETGARFAFPLGSVLPVRGAKLYGSICRDRIAVEKIAPGAKPTGGLNTVARGPSRRIDRLELLLVPSAWFLRTKDVAFP